MRWEYHAEVGYTHELNGFGDEGWELVSSHMLTTKSFQFIFKRPIQEVGIQEVLGVEPEQGTDDWLKATEQDKPAKPKRKRRTKAEMQAAKTGEK